MARALGLIVGSVSLASLGACGVANASAPDSGNPAHCLAAFHYARTIALRGQPSDVDLAVQSTARGLYEGLKLKARGAFDGGRTEGEALLSEQAGNGKAMVSLMLDCAKRQDADAEYRKLNESGALMAAARKADPACKQDTTCRSRMP